MIDDARATPDAPDELAESPRRGGTAVWAPSVTPPIGVDLTDEQALACTFRLLCGAGFSENLAGHITWQRDGQTNMLINPWGLWWEEIAASDICEVDEDAQVQAGRWDVTPAVHIHTELHRVRSDARVVIHNHPYYASVLAALGVLPQLLHQTGSLFLDDICWVEEYVGEIDSPVLASELAAQIGSSNVAILRNHGVIVTGENLQQATYRAASIDRVCRMTYDALVTGREPLQMTNAAMVGVRESLIERAADVYWAGAVRSVLKTQPDVLR
ncbi:MAG TPA: class II aldolase/adducin family protein [Nocardioidaceae bacterium]|nr:class II aldolase/adducin family protein [Nocardioidaceae bacterium]